MIRASVCAFVVAAGVAIALSGGKAAAQGCPNGQTGPLIGTTGEYCLSNTDWQTVDWNQPVFMTTSIGPQTSITVTAPRTICRIWWENPTCWPWPNPPPGVCCGTVGRLSGCGPVVVMDPCLSLSQQGLALIQAAAAACPVPTMPAPVPCGPTKVICVMCACPKNPIDPCERVKLPVKVTATSNVNFIDCIDSANWTDTSASPQSKPCLWIRQKCVEECLSGPPVCANNDATNEGIFGCGYTVVPFDFSDLDPVGGVEVPEPPDGENDEHNPVTP